MAPLLRKMLNVNLYDGQSSHPSSTAVVIDESSTEESKPATDEEHSMSSESPPIPLFDEYLRPLEDDVCLKRFKNYRPIRKNLRNAVNTGKYFRLPYITRLCISSGNPPEPATLELLTDVLDEQNR